MIWCGNVRGPQEASQSGQTVSIWASVMWCLAVAAARWVDQRGMVLHSRRIHRWVLSTA